MKTIYQLYYINTLVNNTRKNIGIYNKKPQALTSLVKNNGIFLLTILNGEARLFMESMVIGEYNNPIICFDSVNDDDMLILKKILFFEALKIWKSNLGCLTEDPETLGFDPEVIEVWDDVPDALALQFLAGDNYVQFINENFN